MLSNTTYRDPNDSFHTLIRNANLKYAVEDAILQQFMDAWVLMEATSKEILFESPAVFDKIWYVENGAMRATKEVNGAEWTYLIAVDGQLISDYVSFIEQTPSLLRFEALSELRFYSLDKAVLNELYQKFPSLHAFGLFFAENFYMETFQRILQFQTKSLKDRYKELIASRPQIGKYVKQQNIASYLGAKPESLSRLKATMNKDAKQNDGE